MKVLGKPKNRRMIGSKMDSVSEKEVKTRYKGVIGKAKGVPIRVVGEGGNPDMVLMSAAHFERRRDVARKDAIAALDRMHDQVKASGATQSEIDQLVQDEIDED